MNTTENNKIIAEFMGGLKDGESRLSLQNNEIWLPIHGVCHLGNSGKVLKYHSSWDWLMEVVEKIRFTQECSDFNINYTCDVKIECEDYNQFFEVYTDNKVNTLQAVYNACIEFIKWHNEQNK